MVGRDPRLSLVNSLTRKAEGISFAHPPDAAGPMNCDSELPRLMPLSLPQVKSPSELYWSSNTDSALFSFAVVKLSAKSSISW